MTVSVYISGVEKVRQRVGELAQRAGSSPPVRKGLSSAGAWISTNQKLRAPVRTPIQRKRIFNKLIAKGKSTGFAAFKAGTVQKKFRSATGQQIKPGLLRRSIGYRVRKRQGEWQVVIGANVGKKKVNPNFAPHRAFVGSGTRHRETRSGARRGFMPPNSYIIRGFMAASHGALERMELGVQQEMQQMLQAVGAST